MPGEREKLHATLEQLHRDLETIDTLDPELRDELRTVLAEIQAALASGEPTTTAEHEEGPVERLQEAVRHFEESHPDLTATLGSIIHALSRLGI